MARRATGGVDKTIAALTSGGRNWPSQREAAHRQCRHPLAKFVPLIKSHLRRRADQLPGDSTCRVFPRPIRPVRRFVVTPGKEEEGCQPARRPERPSLRPFPGRVRELGPGQAGAPERGFQYGLVLTPN